MWDVRWLRPVVVLPFVLMVAGCSSSPIAPDAALGGASVDDQARAAHRLPWRISATVAVTEVPPPAGCLAFFTTVIEGTATHLGEFTGTGTTCVLSQTPDPDPPFTPDGPPPYATAEFTNPRWTLTAANGDELWLETPGAVGVFSLANKAFKAEGAQVIVGGTGRFAGATGEAQVGATNDGTQLADVFSGQGWIQFAGGE
jgi:hypothetical protein